MLKRVARSRAMFIVVHGFDVAVAVEIWLHLRVYCPIYLKLTCNSNGITAFKFEMEAEHDANGHGHTSSIIIHLSFIGVWVLHLKSYCAHSHNPSACKSERKCIPQNWRLGH